MVNKPKNVTSHDCISKLRKLLNTKKIGHTGTLDPFATGVLVCGVGQATRCFQYLPNSDKEYIATIKFGEETDTLDLTGSVINADNFELLNNQIDFEQFLGDIKQVPPMFSAIKLDGRKMYELAREGKKIDLEPRPVSIYSIDELNRNEKENTITIKVECSQGTYIRSLARDIAYSLSTYGHLTQLQRTKSGSHSIEVAQEIFLDGTPKVGDIKDFLFPMTNFEVNADQLAKLRNGMSIKIDEQKISDNTILAIHKSECVAICNVKSTDTHLVLKPLRVFKEGTK